MRLIVRAVAVLIAAVLAVLVQNLLIPKPITVDSQGATADPIGLLWWIITVVAFPVMAGSAAWQATKGQPKGS